MDFKKKAKKGTAIIVCGGKAPEYAVLAPYLNEYDFLIAADSGLDRVLEYNLTPDLIMGDMDSVKSVSFLNSFDENKVKRYPTDKDYTDTELALREAGDYERKILIGGGEGRLDHTLALLALFEGKYHPDLWITAYEVIFPAHDSLIIEGHRDQVISFYPLGDRNIQYHSKGLLWPIDGVDWQLGELSLSNRFTSDKVEITRVKGNLLVIQSLS